MRGRGCTGPSAVFQLSDRYSGNSMRIPSRHRSRFQPPAEGRLKFVLPDGAELLCTLERSKMQLGTGWSAISAALGLEAGSVVRLQQERRGSCRFHIAKLPASAAAALAAQDAAAPSVDDADQQPTAQPAAAAAATHADVLRVKLPAAYVGHSCRIPKDARPQLEAWLPGPPDSPSRPCTLLLPRGQHVAADFRSQTGTFVRGWQAVHRLLKPHAGRALYLWPAAPGSLHIAKQRPGGGTASSLSAGHASGAATSTDQTAAMPSQEVLPLHTIPPECLHLEAAASGVKFVYASLTDSAAEVPQDSLTAGCTAECRLRMRRPDSTSSCRSTTAARCC